MPETWLAAVRIFRAIMSEKSLMTTHLARTGDTWLAALRILRAIISAKLLMLTRCNLSLSNIALRYIVCSYTAKSYWNFSNNTNYVY